MKLSLLCLFVMVASSSHAMVGPGHGSGPAHPSAFLCDQLKGEQVFASAPDGTIEYCTLDEAKVSSMSLWFSLNGELELAMQTYLAHPIPLQPANTAEEYCRAVGGEPQTLIGYDTSIRSDECIFNEGGHLSMIGQETLFRGPRYRGNLRLTELLSGR